MDDALLHAAIDEAIARKPKGHDFVIERGEAASAFAPHVDDRRLRAPETGPSRRFLPLGLYQASLRMLC